MTQPKTWPLRPCDFCGELVTTRPGWRPDPHRCPEWEQSMADLRALAGVEVSDETDGTNGPGR